MSGGTRWCAGLLAERCIPATNNPPSVAFQPHCNRINPLSIKHLQLGARVALLEGPSCRRIALRFETTVQRPVEASGIGLHSGVSVRIRIQPAPVSTGIVFLRTDLDDFPIPASWRHVARVSYATSLMRQGVLISTTEHLLSVFYSMGIDNVFVGIDNLEVPILDGSGLPFVRLIEEAGICLFTSFWSRISNCSVFSCKTSSSIQRLRKTPFTSSN